MIKNQQKRPDGNLELCYLWVYLDMRLLAHCHMIMRSRLHVELQSNQIKREQEKVSWFNPTTRSRARISGNRWSTDGVEREVHITVCRKISRITDCINCSVSIEVGIDGMFEAQRRFANMGGNEGRNTYRKYHMESEKTGLYYTSPLPIKRQEAF
jgi:hypothetical protein